MIFVTQGDQNGIGIEVFLKSFLLLPEEISHLFFLCIHRFDLENSLTKLGITYEIIDSSVIFFNKNLKCIFTDNHDAKTNTTAALELALNHINRPNDILITLPAIKKEIFFRGESCSGHTDYLRKYLNNKYLTMGFFSPRGKILLITEHLSLKQASISFTTELFINKISNTINGLKQITSRPDNIIFSGINPHAGEQGMLGDEENIINDSIKVLQTKYKKINFQGPYAADTIYMHLNNNQNNIIVYAYHDQGLNPFKIINGNIGINITLGAPFIRISVDHGTASNIANKNIANYLGCYYQLLEAYRIQKGNL
jgi:4-hydroxythreonine-4-phosphate dehydrogenase